VIALLRRGALTALLTLVSSFTCLAASSQWKPISIDLAGADLADVLQNFAIVAGGRLQVDPGLEGKVSVRLDDVAWMTALDAVCESAGCVWRLTGPAPRVLVITKTDRRAAGSGLDSVIDIELVGADGADALSAFAVLAGGELTLDDGMRGKVSILLQRVSARTALTALCESLGCTWSRPEGPSGPIVVVPTRDSSPPSALVRGLSERVSIELDHAAIDTTLKSFARLLGCELVLDAELREQVTLELEDVAVMTALNQLCAQADCAWSLVPSGSALALTVERN